MDIDAPDGAERVRELGLPPAAAVVRTARGHQGYYRLPEGRELRQGPLPGVGDLKVTGSGYTLLPPSVHPDGAVYAFVRGDIAGIVSATQLSDEHVDELERLRGLKANGSAVAVGEQIPAGERRTTLLSLAGSMRRRGLTGDEIAVALQAVNEKRCEPPLGENEVLSLALDVGVRYQPDVSVAIQPTGNTGGIDALGWVKFVGLNEYLATPKGSGEAVLGDASAFEVLLPAGGLLKFYGAQGVSKTTLAVDLVAHLASDTDWHGKKVARPVRLAVIENEGPAEQFRQKLSRKVETWSGEPWTDNVVVLDHPHGGFDFRRDDHREELRRLRREDGIDVVVADPTKWLGMEGGGTPDEVRAFVCATPRRGLHSGDPDAALAFILLHHENKAGEVSGAWGADPDTLVHVELDGHQRTKLTWEKCRWALAHHGKVEIYRWLPDTAGLELLDLLDGPQTATTTLDEMLAEWLLANPENTPPPPSATRCRSRRTHRSSPRKAQNTRHMPRPRQKVVPTRRTTPDTQVLDPQQPCRHRSRPDPPDDHGRPPVPQSRNGR